MISVWWTLVAFIGGGCAGLLLVALMRAAADPEEQASRGKTNRCEKKYYRSEPIENA
jgi:hypothetical protein